jgi:hypothetical protein
MTYPFQVNDKVWLNDMQGRQQVPAVIIAQPSGNTGWTIEFEGDNEYGLTGQQEHPFTTDLTPRDA